MPKITSARGTTGWQLFRNRKTLWQMIREVLNGRYKMSLLTVLLIIGTILYIALPNDIIADHIIPLGWVDDAILVFLLYKRLQKETQRYIRFKAMERRGTH